MVIESTADIEQMREVETSDGSTDSPTNESLQQRNVDALENQDGLTAFEHSTSGTAAEQLPSNDVPEGVSVLVTYLESNSGTVYVGDSNSQVAALTSAGSGISFQISNTDAVYIQTPTSGDGVGVLFEGDGT